MKSPDNFSLLISPETIHVAGSMWIRNVIGLAFIATVACFFTAPVTTETKSAYDRPLPLPAELGLELLPQAPLLTSQ
ncbi:hypothetical protein HF313_07565 [Massilia atriviolacea]|uniref:Uncharacterized protein n=1 Tax=Massilia atriviolacea TaxID=2495579 RepID=A0A430HM93_9BURK|nr:hypothetical protein [Massilia atriviolacea]RSZ58602.1 hypothetical protein EJB06_13280 [Massilia atriviolacea]